MNKNQKLLENLKRQIARMGDAIVRASFCDESDLEAIERADELLGNLRMALA